MEKFIVIGGMPRSGTNLVRRIIGSHSEIAIAPAEFQFFRNHSQGKSVRHTLSNERLTDWQVDFSDLYDGTPQDVYVTALQRYARQQGKSIAGEKSPLNEFYLETVEAWLKDFELKFIHMLRNPIDVIASYKNMFFDNNSVEKDNLDRLATVATNWQRSAVIGIAKMHANPDKHIVMKFEDLTAATDVATRTLCEFIGVDFEKERMLNLTDFAEHTDNTSFIQSVDRAETSNRVYQPPSRKQFLMDSEIDAIVKTCGELAWALGYNDENFQPGPPTPEIHKTSRGIISRIRRLIQKPAN